MARLDWIVLVASLGFLAAFGVAVWRLQLLEQMLGAPRADAASGPTGIGP